MNFEYMKNFMNSLTDWIIPGNSIVIYKDGETVFEYSSGYADVENKIEMTPDKPIYIYSCSKPATTAAALQLYEQGKFLMSDPLYEYLPEFRDMKVKTPDGIHKAKNPITIHNLFTMTAGFSYDIDTPTFKKAHELTNGMMDTRTVVKCLAEEPLLFEPGDRWNYSLCHDVLAAFVETVSGMRFSDYVKKNIFDVLDMSGSCYHADDKTKQNMARQYFYDSGGEKDIVALQNSQNSKGILKKTDNVNTLILGEKYDSGGAGIITTVRDYAKFAAALANGGTGVNSGRILSRATVEFMKTNQLNKEQHKTLNWKRLKGYGYGLGVRTMMDKAKSGSNSSIGEFGWGGAAGSNLIIDTEQNLAAFYAHHMLNPQEEFYQPRLINVTYSCI